MSTPTKHHLLTVAFTLTITLLVISLTANWLFYTKRILSYQDVLSEESEKARVLFDEQTPLKDQPKDISKKGTH